MNNINHAVNVFTEQRVNDILSKISEEYEISMDELKTYIEKPQLDERERCAGILKNGKPCNHHTNKDSKYCLKHKYQHEQDSIQTLSQCTAINKNGQRCIRNATTSDDVCGLHRFIGSTSKTTSNHTCVYYDEDEDQNHIFCNQFSMKNIWFCKKHAHLQNVYMHQYKAKNLNHYKERVNNNEIQPNAVIQELLNDHLE